MKTSTNNNKNLEKILSRWRFPEDIIEKYKILGIKEIFDWQYECLSIASISDLKQNLVYSAPTSAGKTLVAELLMLKNVLDLKRKAILILPYVSLAKEKLENLQFILSDSFLKVDGFIGNYSPHGGFANIDIAVCTIEKANSLLNRQIDEDLIFDLGVIVVDELHMVNDSSRGYLLELILSKIKFLCIKSQTTKIQIIGMSATLPDLKNISDWLDATLYQTSFRPIHLLELIKYEADLIDKTGTVVSNIKVNSHIENDVELLAHLVLETIFNRLGVLVFCPTKSRCETLAENIARSIYSMEKNQQESIKFLDKDKLIACLNDLKNTPSGLDSQLSKTVRYGVAFHHAGLTTEEREIVENNFKNGHLLVICCTSTLSSGINFPARRVIIRTPIFNGKPLDVMSYKQMAGRAGRKGIDTCGESILMCSNANERKIAESLLNANLVDCSANRIVNTTHVTKQQQTVQTSDLSASMKRALLETIVSGVVVKRSEIIQYVNCFIASKTSAVDYEKYLKWLNSNQFVDIVRGGLAASDANNIMEEENYKPTQLGYAIVASSMAPDEGLIIFGELQRAMQCFVLENELHIIYQITPINICDYWQNSSASVDWNMYYTMVQNFPADFKRVSDLVGVRPSFLLKMIKGSSINANSSAQEQKLFKIHLRFYTSLILNDLVNEVPFSKILLKFGCQKGFLQTLQQSSSTYAAMVTVFCNRLGWYNLESLVNQFQSRLLFGVQRQLLDLIRIQLLNSHRARLFYSAGYTTVASLAMCDSKKIEKILRSGMTFSLNSNNNAAKKEGREEYNNSEVVIWHESRGYTYWEASAVILEECNAIVRSDVEQLGVKLEVERKQKADSGDKKKSADKSLFHFNETIDSMIQSQQQQQHKSMRKSPVGASKEADDKSMEKIREEEETENIVRMEIMQVVEEQTTHKEKNAVETVEQDTVSNTQMDDQYLLKMVDTFESANAKSAQKREFNSVKRAKSNQDVFETPSPKYHSKKKINDINTTIVSDEILQMCADLEKNALSSKNKLATPVIEKTKSKPPTSKAEAGDCRKSLNFSFGDETLKNILNTQNTQTGKSIGNRSERVLHANKVFEKLKPVLCELEKASTLKISSIHSTTTDLESFDRDVLKPKSVLSISFACENFEQCDETMSGFFHFYDNEKLFRFLGIFICNELEKSKKHIMFMPCIRDDEANLSFIRNIFDRDDLIKIMFFSKKHAKLIFKALGVTVKMPCYDPVMANWLLTHELATIIQIKQKYCANLNFLSIDSVFKNNKSCYGCNYFVANNRNASLNLRHSMHGSLFECLIGVYCFEKVKLQLQLQNIWIYFAKIESDIVLLSSEIEMIGFGLDSNELEQTKSVLLKKKKEIEDRVRLLTDCEINLGSPNEVAMIIYDKLKLKPIVDDRKVPAVVSHDKFKHYKTSKDVLQQLASQHEFPKLVIIWRKISHTLGNSIYPIERAKLYDKSTEMYRIYPSIDLYTVTGRMNFYEPCLQNIPRDFEISMENVAHLADTDVDSNENDSVKSSEAYLHENEVSMFFLEKINENEPAVSGQNMISIRKAFISSQDCVLLSADYCQLEFRIITNMCQDDGLISAFNDNVKGDVFNILASKWLKLPLSEVDEEKRQNVKKIVYGIIYGISAKTLALFLNLSESEAAHFIDSFKASFPGLKKFINAQVENCRLKGYVESIRKRRRNLPNIVNMDNKQRAQAERQAINTIIQGSASDLVKSAMVKIEKTLRKKYGMKNVSQTRGARLVMQLHDELIYEVNRQDLIEVQAIVKDCMENCMELPVKMKIKMKTGQSWGLLTTVV